MQRTRPGLPPLLLFVAASLGIHSLSAIALRSLHRRDADAERVFDPSSPSLTGDTLDVEPVAETPAEGDQSEPDTAPAPSLALFPAATPRAAPGPTPRRGLGAPSPSGAVVARPALFGAVGVRSASDLATTFTRAFPQAASADPVWSVTPFGAAGAAELTLVLDDDGHLSRSSVSGSPSLALRRGIDRTLALLGTGRAFTARGATTKIRLAARVSRDDVHDGLHGDVFALSGGSFSGDVGGAFFALPPTAGPGRRVDVELRLLP